MALPSEDVQTATGYVIYRLNFGDTLQQALDWTLDRMAVRPAARGAIAKAVRNVIRKGEAVTTMLNVPEFAGTLQDVLQGTTPPSPDVGVRVNFYNPTTREWRQQFVAASWDEPLQAVLDRAYQSLQSFESGGPGFDRQQFEVTGATWLPHYSQR